MHQAWVCKTEHTAQTYKEMNIWLWCKAIIKVLGWHVGWRGKEEKLAQSSTELTENMQRACSGFWHVMCESGVCNEQMDNMCTFQKLFIIASCHVS